MKKKSWISAKNWKRSRKVGTSTLTSMNLSGSIPNISGIEPVMTNGSELKIMNNGLENPITIGITAFAMTG